ncbi:MAG: CopG family transcriptional regulator [Nitrospira sp.]|nr:CopG family transcriptional regulator [Nitrospira sp.]
MSLSVRLDQLATWTGRTKTFYIQQLLVEHLDELEDRYLTEQRLETPTTRLTSQEMRHELGFNRRVLKDLKRLDRQA